jgi:hypothetical protein
MSARDVIADHAHWLGAFDDAGRNRDATMILAALRAAGYVVVPREPTQRMIQAVAQLDFSAQHDPTWPEYYAAMLSAYEGDAP